MRGAVFPFRHIMCPISMYAVKSTGYSPPNCFHVALREFLCCCFASKHSNVDGRSAQTTMTTTCARIQIVQPTRMATERHGNQRPCTIVERIGSLYVRESCGVLNRSPNGQSVKSREVDGTLRRRPWVGYTSYLAHEVGCHVVIFNRQMLYWGYRFIAAKRKVRR